MTKANMRKSKLATAMRFLRRRSHASFQSEVPFSAMSAECESSISLGIFHAWVKDDEGDVCEQVYHHD